MLSALKWMVCVIAVTCELVRHACIIAIGPSPKHHYIRHAFMLLHGTICRVHLAIAD